MRALTFTLRDALLALPLDAVRKLVGPAEPLPEGAKIIDLAQWLQMPPARAMEPPDSERQRALLAQGGSALVLGRALGIVTLKPEWILPLPSAIFRVRRPPFLGIIDPPEPERTRAGSPLPHPALLLDVDSLTAGAFDG